MIKDTANQDEILACIVRYKNAYSNKDVNILLDMADPDFFGFGSGPDEKVNNLDELESQLLRDFAQSDNIEMDFGSLTVALDGNVAWCAGDCTISAEVSEERLRIEGRMTAVLRRTANGWLFAHTHFSVPDRGQKAGQSFPERK